jgi:hypothetical protein
MRTQIEVQAEKTEQLRREAIELSGRDHTSDEMAGLMRDAGSQIELFLKDAIYAGTRNRDSSYDLIEGLRTQGIPAKVVDDLHAVRREYNEAKHDPAYPAPPNQVIERIGLASNSLAALQQHGIGNINAPSRETYRRTFWIGAWDHYIGGDTEIYVALPTTAEMRPRPFDMIYIDGVAWDNVVAQLQAVGDLRLGRGTIPDSAYDFWSNEGDFLEAGSYQGNYREMIAILAANERRHDDLLPFLKRENDEQAVRNALLLAVVDVAEQYIPEDEQALAELISTTAAERYAIPRYAPQVKVWALILARLLLSVPEAARAGISGPLWVTPGSFAASREGRIAEMDGILVAADGRVLLNL